jgi:DNA mismatch endonuclease (patch repair protein)
MVISRSENMRRVKGKNTQPEITVRLVLRSLGYSGYRLHRKELPGTPDIVYVGRRKAILIHGCFWHGHDCKHGLRKPKENADYWRKKIGGNQQRDSNNLKALSDLGWEILVIWECMLKDQEQLSIKLREFMSA